MTHPDRFSCTVMTHLCSISMRLVNMPNIEANRGVTYSGCMHDFSSGMFVAFFASDHCHLALLSMSREGCFAMGQYPSGCERLRCSEVPVSSWEFRGVWMRLDMCVIRRASRGVMYNIISLGK